MTAKTVVLRERALLDADEAIAYYLREAGEKVALAFIDALERAHRQIARYPASGSPRYAHELDLPGLRPKGGTPHFKRIPNGRIGRRPRIKRIKRIG